MVLTIFIKMIYDRFLGMYLGNYLGAAVSVEKPFHSYIFEWFIPSYLVLASHTLLFRLLVLTPSYKRWKRAKATFSLTSSGSSHSFLSFHCWSCFSRLCKRWNFCYKVFSVPNVRFNFWAWHFKKESTNHDRSYMQELRPDILGCNCGNGSNPSQ